MYWRYSARHVLHELDSMSRHANQVLRTIDEYGGAAFCGVRRRWPRPHRRGHMRPEVYVCQRISEAVEAVEAVEADDAMVSVRA